VPHLTVQRVGSLFWLCLAAQGAAASPMRALSDFPADAGKRFTPLFHSLLDQGIYLAPSAFEVGFLSTAHTGSHIDALAERIRTHCAA
jgi:glutamate-1-semialdehyde 2,1-aminomutase